jgi:hypothetical protein
MFCIPEYGNNAKYVFLKVYIYNEGSEYPAEKTALK